MSDHRQQAARFAAPAAFLLAVTILVLIVRSATSEDEPTTATPVASTQAPTTTTAPAATQPPADTTPATTTAAASTYTIEAGDTLQTIADQYGTTVEELLVLNPDVDPTALQIGQTIRVP